MGQVSQFFTNGDTSGVLTYPVLLFFPPLLLLFVLLSLDLPLPPRALQPDVLVSAAIQVCATLLVGAFPVVNSQEEKPGLLSDAVVWI
jgi:hypothetical protein